nr:MAG TPA: hypothetical protein [Caudoviricetes sp.]DAH71980.1 MAG TPA: hypothetical protein [Caudoviricetes sp.]
MALRREPPLAVKSSCSEYSLWDAEKDLTASPPSAGFTSLR